MTPLTADGRPVARGSVRIPITWRISNGPMPDEAALPGVTACLGQVAHQAELDPHGPGAWRAVMYWTIQMETLSASMFMGPASVELLARDARLAATNGTLDVPRGWSLKTCLAKVPKP